MFYKLPARSGPIRGLRKTQFFAMHLNTVIFDMDGLLIDSEPLWQRAAAEALARFDIRLTDEQYHQTTGLGTRQFVEKFMAPLSPTEQLLSITENEIVSNVIGMVRNEAQPMPGVPEIFKLFKSKNFKIGLATSSPFALIRVVTEKLGIQESLSAISSGNELPFGKPHPQVFLNCAEELDSSPLHCICFEDSFNGMIAAKAARMTCVVVPAPAQRDHGRWDAADKKLNSLLEFNGDLLIELGGK